MNNFLITDEVAYLYHATYECLESRTGSDGAWQVAPFQCSIPYSRDAVSNLIDLREFLREEFEDLIVFGERRAVKAFEQRSDSVTKPSYISRIENYVHGFHDQAANMLQIAEREPASGGLVFSVFSPQDLVDRRRPGYVPCLISGSFLLHDNELHMNVFFRSQSVVEFGLFDMLFLRSFHEDFFVKYSEVLRDNGEFRVGPLNLHIGRVLVHRRMIKSNKSFISRSEIVGPWLRKIEEFRVLRMKR